MEKLLLHKETAERMVFFAALLMIVGVLCTWAGIGGDRFLSGCIGISFWLQTWGYWSLQERKIWALPKWLPRAFLGCSVGMTVCFIVYWAI